jgi:hypothetical protein
LHAVDPFNPSSQPKAACSDVAPFQDVPKTVYMKEMMIYDDVSLDL